MDSFIKEFFDITEQIKTLNAELLPLKKKKQELNDILKEYMERDDVGEIDVKNRGVLVYNKVKTTVPVNKGTMQDTVEQFFTYELKMENASEIALRVYEYATNNPIYKEKSVLKIKKSSD